VQAPVRRRALALCEERILYEQMASRRQGISPVNGLLNCLALHSIDPQHEELGPSLDAMETWKWEDEIEGLRFAGAHSTAWDTAFSIRALAATHKTTLSSSAQKAVRAAYRWLGETQLQEDLPDHERQRREAIRGGWCFSDGQHRWPVSDCTAEALTAILEAEAAGIVPKSERLPRARLAEAVAFILARQNDDGGFGSYEPRRAGALLELINPSEMYGNCMTERSYTECTASCVGALVRWLREDGAARRGVNDAASRQGGAAPLFDELASRAEAAVGKAVALLQSKQRSDGSYLGFWGVNFTYGIFHAVEALVTAGVGKKHRSIAGALAWLVDHQKADGGWGEHWKSCMTDAYVEHAESQPAMTAWALLALAEGRDPAADAKTNARIDEAIERGRSALAHMQETAGAWPQKAQSGVFFSTAMLDYRLYKDVFPTWALARA
jgi:lanosterol synthase